MTSDAERASRSWWSVTPWHLVWLGTLAFQPLYDNRDRMLQWIVVGAVVAVFVPLYVSAVRSGPAQRWAPVLTVALAVLVTPLNSGATVLFIYAAAFVGGSLPRRSALRWLAAFTVLIVALAVVSNVPMPWRVFAFTPNAILLWVIGLSVMAGVEKARADRFYNAHVEHFATLSERERISRDLHDLLGQTLTGIVVRSQLAQRLAARDVAAGIAEMAKVERAARTALTEVRATVSGWRAVDLDQELTTVTETLATAGVALTVTRDPDLVLTPSAETALGLALRETVTNVVRHAHATRCTIALHHVGAQVVLEVTDDGVGGEQREGNGITGMRERIAALGGDVDRQVHGGTAVTVAVPAAVAT